MAQILRSPCEFTGITQRFKPGKHLGWDFGWHDYLGEPIFASATGKVVACGTDVDGAIYAVISHDNVIPGKVVITRYWHLASLVVAYGQKVKMGDKIGSMGSTGNSSGVHLHYEMWICPAGYTYKYTDKGKYSTDPTEYLYVYADQKRSAQDTFLKMTKKTLADGIKDGEVAPTPAPTPAPAKDDFLPARGYFTFGDNSAKVGQIAKFMRAVFPAYTPAAALGNYFGKNLLGAVKEFQRRTNLEADGNIGPLTLAKMKEYGFKE